MKDIFYEVIDEARDGYVTIDGVKSGSIKWQAVRLVFFVVFW